MNKIDRKATNIRLDARMLKLLKLKAAEENKSVAGLIREAVSEVYGIPAAHPHSVADFKQDPFFKLVGMCSSGIKDGAIHHDRDIYGLDRF
ncbi:MAG: ribbon-helix-helix protein, CopG family [Candidatus Omnitrophica bacterium]|nr:ribbon-helix-helix protein, CopG family [Candidatus Omnitrophota bacterium]